MTEPFSSFVKRVENFEQLTPTDKICHAAWYLHEIKRAEHFSSGQINTLFDEIHETPPHTSVYLKRMVDRKPPLLLKGKSGYKLERRPRSALDAKYNDQPSTAVVGKMLSDLRAKMPSQEEIDFLDETLRCYSVLAFRASIVMAWNLAYDHLIKWILVEPARLTSFNISLAAKFPKKAFVLSTTDDFAEFKEFDVVETCQHAKLITKNIGDLLREKLKRRNSSAHPSSVVITQAQADDVITDLVNNIVLRLKLS